MATLVIPQSARSYFPETVSPFQLWMNYNAKADSLTVYFTGEPVPSVWQDVDEYAYIGFALDDETTVTGLKIEHFNKWQQVTEQGITQ